MKTITSVLAAVDFSADSRRAAHRAALIAGRHKARLELLHVMSESSLDALRRLFGPSKPPGAALREGADRMLGEVATEIAARDGIRAGRRIEVGEVVDAILAASARASLLAIGARGLNPLRDTILGSTAVRLLGRRPGPVLVVKRAPRGPYRRILVPVDFSPHSVPALRLARAIAPAAEITVLHAYAVPFEGKLRYAGVSDEHLRALRAQARAEAAGLLAGLCREAGLEGGPWRTALACGSAGRIILSRERSTAADLVVIGKHGRSGIEKLLLGGVTRHVLADATSDVLVVHEPDSAG
ncbi:MAG: universal stress protein [Burkholderiales bacterium]